MSSSRISITFDLWMDKRARGFIAVTGHYFDQSLVLRAPLIAIKHLSKGQEGHTALRIYESVSSELQKVIGDRWKSKLYCAVTDGASNVSAASQMLALSRRCVQHSLQLVLKHFCASQAKVATALACCNYFARLSKISQKFRAAVGCIPAGVITRWNSYMDTAMAVYRAKAKLNDYVDSALGDGEIASQLRLRHGLSCPRGLSRSS